MKKAHFALLVRRASSDNEHSAIEIALNGGQVGDADLFCVARDGNNHR
jgi:uncharacterized protein YgbK (DUF1537 family)